MEIKEGGWKEVFLMGVSMFMGMTLAFLAIMLTGEKTPEQIEMLTDKTHYSLIAEMVCLNGYLIVDYYESLQR
jgi:hypothetical protein